MNTATTLLNAVTLTAAAEFNAGAVGVDLTAVAVNDIALEITATNGGTAPGAGRYVDVYLAWGTAVTGSGIPDTYGPSCEKYRILLSPDASAVRVSVASNNVVKKARYAYVWYSHEALLSTVTLTVKVVS